MPRGELKQHMVDDMAEHMLQVHHRLGRAQDANVRMAWHATMQQFRLAETACYTELDRGDSADGSVQVVCRLYYPSSEKQNPSDVRVAVKHIEMYTVEADRLGDAQFASCRPHFARVPGIRHQEEHNVFCNWLMTIDQKVVVNFDELTVADITDATDVALYSFVFPHDIDDLTSYYDIKFVSDGWFKPELKAWPESKFPTEGEVDLLALRDHPDTLSESEQVDCRLLLQNALVTWDKKLSYRCQS